MRISKALVAVAAFSALLGPVAALAVEDGDVDRSHPKAFVKDSIITEADGVVWLSGTAPSQNAIDKAPADPPGCPCASLKRTAHGHIAIA